MQKNYYDVIGLRPSASQSEIEDACIAMATKYDPSKNIGNLKAKLMFTEVEEAYAEDREAWNRSFMCLSCGHKFERQVNSVI